jgi:hypothetical protein
MKTNKTGNWGKGPGMMRICLIGLLAVLFPVSAQSQTVSSDAASSTGQSEDGGTERMVGYPGADGAVGVRISDTLVVISGDAKIDATVNLEVRDIKVPGSRPGRPGTVAGKVVKVDEDHGLLLVEVPTAAGVLDGVSIFKLARHALQFADEAQIQTPAGVMMSAAIGRPNILFFLPKTTGELAVYPTDAVASPLYNSCGDFAGFVTPQGDETPPDFQVTSVSGLRALIADHDDAWEAAEESCTVEDGASDGLDKLGADAVSRAEAADADAATAEAALASVRNSGRVAADSPRMRALTADVATARTAADAARNLAKDFDEMRNDNRRGQFIDGGLIVLALGFFGFGGATLAQSRRTVRTVDPAIEQLNRNIQVIRDKTEEGPWADVVLRGATDTFKIPGSWLIASGPGVLVGRDAKTNRVHIPYGDISRKHCRLFVDDQCLWVVDSQSTHGTSVESGTSGGYQKTTLANNPVKLDHGAVLVLASHKFDVEIRRKS